MRKDSKKLELSRETLRGLEPGKLRRVRRAGGAAPTALTCGASCIHNCGTQYPECPTLACP